jgi:hypothetical protein
MIPFDRLGRKLIASGTCVTAAAVLFGSTRRPSEGAAPDCHAWQVEYSIAGNLQVSDTLMRAGDGTYPVGPGRMVLRFDRAGGPVALLSYELPERFGIEVRKVFWTTRVNTDAVGRITPGACGRAASGTLQGSTLVWSSRVDGLRTDGTLECKGSMCGKFGAPAPGTSPLHVGPSSVAFQPFEFGRDGKTFTMASTLVSRSEVPKQTAHLSLSGREVRRSCAPMDPCR